MNNRIDDLSLVRSNYRREGARAHREEGDFFGVTRVARFMAIVAACCGAGCGSPEPQSGTNTNWACGVDADCETHDGTSCQDGFCVESAVQPDAAPPSTPTEGGPTVSSLAHVVATDTGLIASGYRYNPTQPPGDNLAVASSNGRDWAVIDARGGTGIGHIVFGNGTVVATSHASEKPGFMVMPPGGTWQFHQVDFEVDALLFGNGVFFAVRTNEGGSMVSTDGIDWTQAPAIDSRVYGFVNGQFLGWIPDDARTRMRTSTDGITWSDPKPVPGRLAAPGFELMLAAAAKETVGVGYDTCDGEVCWNSLLVWNLGLDIWSVSAAKAPWASTPEFIPTGIAASESRVGIVTTRNDAKTSQIWTTAMPLSSEPWQRADIPQDWELRDIAFGAGVFVVVGQMMQGIDQVPVLATSSDGLNWEEISIGLQ